jgi:hypothetical protein
VPSTLNIDRINENDTVEELIESKVKEKVKPLELLGCPDEIKKGLVEY